MCKQDSVEIDFEAEGHKRNVDLYLCTPVSKQDLVTFFSKFRTLFLNGMYKT